MKPSTANRILMVMALLWLLAACTGADAELVEPEATPVATATRVPTATPTAVPTATPTLNPTPPRPGLGEPCDYPCWMGLVPGESTLEEAIWAVRRASTPSDRFWDHSKRIYSDGSARVTGDVRQSGRIRYRVEAFVRQDGVLESIRLVPHGDWPTLGEIVDELGEPDALSMPSYMSLLPDKPCSCSTLRPGRLDPYQLPDFCSDDNGECQEQYWLISLSYRDRGLMLFTYRYLEEFPCLCREMLVDELLLVTVPALVLDYHFHWPGFGRVDLDQLEEIGAGREGSDP